MNTLDFAEMGRKRAQRTRLMNKGIYTPPVDTQMHRRETKTHYIEAAPARADMELQKFYEKMQNKNGFRVISVNTVSIPKGVAMYVTYEITT